MGESNFQLAQAMVNYADDGLKWYINQIPESDDILTIIKQIDPLMDVLVNQEDVIRYELTIKFIEDHFRDGKSVSNIVKKQIKQGKSEKMNNDEYLQDLPFFEKKGVYWHRMAKATVPISNFKLTIQDRILFEDEVNYRCTLKSVSGEVVEDVLFAPQERVDSRKFRIAVQAVGDFHFTGRDHELSGIWQFEQARSEARIIILVNRFGRIRERDLWLFGNCAIGEKIYPVDSETDYAKIGKYNIKSHEVRVYQNALPLIDIDTEYTREFAVEVAKNFNIMLDSTASGKIQSLAGYLFLGFVAATVYSDEIFDRYLFFPFLFSYGPKGTGKSSATGLLMSFFGFMGRREDFSEATGPGISQVMNQLSSIPYWVDEFRNGGHFDKLSGTIKNIYNRVGVGKGGLTHRTVREVLATFWMSGEYMPDEEAVVSRSVIFRFGPLNAHKNEAYTWLMNNQQKLSVITRQLILEKNEESIRFYIQQIETINNYLQSRDIDPRIASNYAIIGAGLQVLNVPIPDEFDEYLYKHAKSTVNYTQEENVSLIFFKELNTCHTKGLVHKRFAYYREKDTELCIRFESVFSIIQLERRRRGEDFRVKSSEMMDYLKDVPGFVHNDGDKGLRRYFQEGDSNVQRVCIVFDVKYMPDRFRMVISDMIDDATIEEILIF